MALLTNINGKFSVSDAGAVTFNNAFTFPTADGTANYVLKTNGSGQLAWGPDNDGGDITGSGTANTVTKFTGAKTIGDGPITFSSNDSTFAGTVLISGVSNYTGLTVKGSGASRPAITFSNVNQGDLAILYGTESNALVIATGASGTAALTLDSSQNATFAGQVGVAGKTPAYGLTLAQGTGVNNKIAWTDGTPNFRASIYANSSNDKFTIATGNASSVETTALEIDTSQNSTFSGNVSVIGSAKFIEVGSANTGTNFGFIGWNAASKYLFIGNSYNSAYNEDIIIDSSGNVGIGTTSPDTQLHIYNSDSNWGAYSVITLGTDVEGTNQAQLKYYRGASTSTESFQLSVRGTTALTALYNGNVGIGTTSPGNLLDVAGDTDISGQLFVQHSGSYTAKLKQLATSMSNATYTFEIDSTAHTSNMSTAGAMSVDVDSGRAFTINGLGSVGVGTNSPSEKLTLQLDAQNQAFSGKNGTDYLWFLRNEAGAGARQSGRFQLMDTDVTTVNIESASNRNTYFNAGNVGIGTTGPVQPLTVAGNVLFRTTTADNFENRFQFIVGGSGDPGNFYVYNDTESPKVRLNAGGDSYFVGGDVGIGETSPSQKLNVRDDGGSDVFRGIEVHNNNQSLARAGIAFQCYDWVQSAIWHGRSTTAAYGGALVLGTNPNTSDLSVGGVTGRMWILNNGNVGIGTSSPANKLTVNGDIGFTGFLGQGSIFGNTGNASYTEMQLYSPSTGYTTIDNKAYGYYFATAGSTKLTILNNGNVGIGNTSPQTTLHVGTTTTVTNQFTNQVNASNFFVNGNANGGASFFQCKTAAVNINMMGNNDFACNQFTFYHKPLSTSQNVVGTIATFSSSTQYNTTSDYRLKENVIPLSDSIIRLKQLKPSRFNFIEDPERTMDGFLAHEVQNTVPEAVNGEKDAVDENGNEVHQGIDQAKLVPLLVAAVQEQQEIIESLKQRIEQLEN